MKYILAILSVTAVTLFGININSLVDINKPLHSEAPKTAASTNYDLNKCPAPIPSYSTQIIMDLEYKHCASCDHGVFLEHDDGVRKCSYCGVKETTNN
jgi:hypothetical protein